MNARFLAIPALALAFLGAGCTPATSPVPTTDDVPVTEAGSQDSYTLNISRLPGNQEAPPTFVPAQTDDTWKTYTNAALGFSFQTPTKGRYAPQWEVKVIRDDAPEVSDGYSAEGGTIDSVRFGNTPDRQEFYVNYGTKEADGIVYLSDAYSTYIGRSVVVIIFSKKAIVADIENCTRKPNQKFWSEFAKPGSCVAFSEEEYFKTLDSIVGTFKTK